MTTYRPNELNPQLFAGIGNAVAQRAQEHRAKEENIRQGSILQGVLSSISQRGENAGLHDVLGDISQGLQQGWSPQNANEFLGQVPKLLEPGIKRENAKTEANRKMQESQKSSVGALETLQEMKDILKKGNLGPYISGAGARNWNVPGSPKYKEAAKERAQYERLGKSLIQQASNIPIRNRQEFETLAQSLYDTDIPQSEIEGILEAMENIIRRSLGESVQSPVQPIQPIQSRPGEGANIPSSPEGWRGQNEKNVKVRERMPNGKFSEPFEIPRAEYQKHPNLEELADGMNQ